MDIGKVIEDIERQASSNGDIDYLHFKTWLEIIDKVGAFVLSLLLALIIVVVPFVVILEVAYISFPALRTGVADKILFKGDGKVQKAMQLTLHDAIKALELANTVKTGKSALAIYMQIKMKWLLLVAISLTIYLGGIDIIIDITLNLISGLLEAIQRAIF